MSVIKAIVDEPVIDYPVINLLDVQIQGATKQGNIWWVDADKEMVIDARMQNIIEIPGQQPYVVPFPNTEMSCPVIKMVLGVPVDAPRFKARIYNVPAATTDLPSIVMMQLKLTFPTGNYLLSPEYLNRSLAEIKAPFRLNFEPVDIDSIVVVAQS